MDKLAKEFSKGNCETWKERSELAVIELFKDEDKKVERAVVLALSVKQAEEKGKDVKLQLNIENACTKAEGEGFERGKKESQAEVLKEIDEEIVLHLNNAEATNEPCCNCMVENEGDCETMKVLKGLRKRLLAKSEAKKRL